MGTQITECRASRAEVLGLSYWQVRNLVDKAEQVLEYTKQFVLYEPAVRLAERTIAIWRPELRELGLARIIAGFNIDDDHVWGTEPGLPRYAAVTLHHLSDDYGPAVRCWDSLAVAFGALEDDVCDGYEPEGIYDLDTGRKIEVNVSVKVTVAEGNTSQVRNVLEAREEEADDLRRSQQ